MRLEDRIDVYTTATAEGTGEGTLVGTVRANISYTKSDLQVTPQAIYQVEEMRVIIEPLEGVNADRVRLTWQGERLNRNGPALIRRRNGHDHHWTFPVFLST